MVQLQEMMDPRCTERIVSLVVIVFFVVFYFSWNEFLNSIIKTKSLKMNQQLPTRVMRRPYFISLYSYYSPQRKIIL